MAETLTTARPMATTGTIGTKTPLSSPAKKPTTVDAIKKDETKPDTSKKEAVTEPESGSKMKLYGVAAGAGVALGAAGFFIAKKMGKNKILFASIGLAIGAVGGYFGMKYYQDKQG